VGLYDEESAEEELDFRLEGDLEPYQDPHIRCSLERASLHNPERRFSFNLDRLDMCPLQERPIRSRQEHHMSHRQGAHMSLQGHHMAQGSHMQVQRGSHMQRLESNHPNHLSSQTDETDDGTVDNNRVEYAVLLPDAFAVLDSTFDQHSL